MFQYVQEVNVLESFVNDARKVKLSAKTSPSPRESAVSAFSSAHWTSLTPHSHHSHHRRHVARDGLQAAGNPPVVTVYTMSPNSCHNTAATTAERDSFVCWSVYQVSTHVSTADTHQTFSPTTAPHKSPPRPVNQYRETLSAHYPPRPLPPPHHPPPPRVGRSPNPPFKPPRRPNAKPPNARCSSTKNAATPAKTSNANSPTAGLTQVTSTRLMI